MEGKYIDDLQLAWSSNTSQGTTVRFILGHSRPLQQYLDHKGVSNRMEELGIETLVPDRIQSQKRVLAGYLAGPLLEPHTVNDLLDILKEKDIFKANGVAEMDIDIQLIRTHSRRMNKSEARVRALHVTVAKDVKATARSCLQKTFPSQPRPDYPLGLQFRFVPNIIDEDFAVPPKARGIAEKLRSRQADLISRCHTRNYDHIKNIHSVSPSADFVVLSRILMGMKSRVFVHQFLFVAAEQAYYGDPVKFTYLAEMADEVDSIIPVLPLILVGELGQEAQEWFKPSASVGTDGFQYDPVKRAVVPNGNHVLKPWTNKADWMRWTASCRRAIVRKEERDLSLNSGP